MKLLVQVKSPVSSDVTHMHLPQSNKEIGWEISGLLMIDNGRKCTNDRSVPGQNARLATYPGCGMGKYRGVLQIRH
jgi:hypothetical protein